MRASFTFLLFVLFHYSKTVSCYVASINLLRGSTVQCLAALLAIYCVCVLNNGEKVGVTILFHPQKNPQKVACRGTNVAHSKKNVNRRSEFL